MPAVMPLKEWALAPEVNSSQDTAIQKPFLVGLSGAKFRAEQSSFSQSPSLLVIGGKAKKSTADQRGLPRIHLLCPRRRRAFRLANAHGAAARAKTTTAWTFTDVAGHA